jgi:hypothetical protein
VWDRFTERPFFCSQRAIRNVSEESDVVLYLVNAAEEPAAAGISLSKRGNSISSFCTMRAA